MGNIANYSMSVDSKTIEKGIVTLFAKIAIGAAGAASFVTTPPVSNTQIGSLCKGWGSANPTRTATGKYTLPLTRPYQYLMHLSATIVNASGTPIASNLAQVIVEQDNSNASGGAQNLVIQVLNSAGAAADLASGCVILLKADFKYGTV